MHGTVDLSRHRELQEQGLLSIQQHPTLPLLIHNYTQRCQWERAWDDMTVKCRGLITDLQGYVVCRPFPKFFNLGEHTAPDSKLPPINWRQEFHVTEKLDGSLGILYPTGNGHAIATRGSFVSDQAIRATSMLRRLGTRISDEHTYLFEIIYPQNRIVIDYGATEELVLLDLVHTSSGLSAPRRVVESAADLLGCRAVATHDLTAEQLANYSSNEPNREGVVVRFADGMRIKIKLNDYVRLHKLITGVNARHIWEHLRDGRLLAELIEHVPDEFMQWVQRIADELDQRYLAIWREASDVLGMTKLRLRDADRKSYAAAFNCHPDIRAILFLMLDGREFRQAIWKQLRPESTATFQQPDE